MRKKLLSLVAIATIVFFGACSNEELLPEPDQTSTFSFTASMPDEPDTRVTLNEDGKNITLRWEYTDILQVVYVKDGVEREGIATINTNSISEDGKKAIFNTPLPEGTFDFYGVYGGGGLSGTNAILPTNPTGSLENIQTNKDVMLYFAHKGVTQSDLNNGVTFNHLGSLFKIMVQNNCTTGTLNLEQGAQLVGIDETNENWAYNFNTPSTVFDLTTETFQNTGTGINSIPFSTDKVSIAPNEEIAEYWTWYPVLPNSTFPELKLTLISANPNDLTTVNSKDARTTPIVAGKNYRFYAEFDGTVFNFTNDKFVVTP